MYMPTAIENIEIASRLQTFMICIFPNRRAPVQWVKVLLVFGCRKWLFENLFYCHFFPLTKFTYCFRVIMTNTSRMKMKKTVFSKQFKAKYFTHLMLRTMAELKMVAHIVKVQVQSMRQRQHDVQSAIFHFSFL